MDDVRFQPGRGARPRPEGDQLLLTFPDADLAHAIYVGQGVLYACASVAVVAVIAVRWWRASPPRRRAMLPSLGGAFGLLWLTTVLVNALVAGTRSQAMLWIAVCSLLGVPIAFLPRCCDRGSPRRAGRALRVRRGGHRCHGGGVRARRLLAEAETQLAELKASRERIVAAGDAERRRLERNLHDGAQQRLVAISFQLRCSRVASASSATNSRRSSNLCGASAASWGGTSWQKTSSNPLGS